MAHFPFSPEHGAPSQALRGSRVFFCSTPSSLRRASHDSWTPVSACLAPASPRPNRERTAGAPYTRGKHVLPRPSSHAPDRPPTGQISDVVPWPPDKFHLTIPRSNHTLDGSMTTGLHVPVYVCHIHTTRPLVSAYGSTSARSTWKTRPLCMFCICGSHGDCKI